MDVRKQRILLGWTIAFFWASEYCHVPYFTPYLQTLGFAAETIGFIAGFYGLTQMIVRIPLGILTDATSGYKKAIVMGTFFTTFSSFLLIFAKTEVTIIICRALAGLAASTWLAFTLMFNALHAQEEGVAAMANVNAYSNLGRMVAFILGMASSTIWGIKMPLWFSVWTGLVAFVLSLFVVQVPIKREPFRLSHVAQVAVNPIILVASFFGIVMQGICQGTVYAFTSTIMRDRLLARNAEIGLSTMLFTIIQVVLAPYAGKKLKNADKKIAIPIGFVFFVFSILLSGFAQNVWMVYGANILGGVGNMILTALLLNMVASSVPEEKKATAMGFYQAIYGLGMTLGPNMVGKLADSHSLYFSYGVVAAITTATAAVAPLLLLLTQKKKEA